MLMRCLQHNITYDEDEYPEVCPACVFEKSSNRYEKLYTEYENKELECVKEGQRDMARIIRDMITKYKDYDLRDVTEVINKTLKEG